METPEPGSIESAIAGLLRPEEPVEQEETAEADELEQEPVEEEEVIEDDEPEDDEEGEEPVEDDEDAEEAEDSEPELYTVKVDGKEERVSLEDLKRGYSGQKYVQKGMQEAAEQRKQAEAVYAALLNERQQVAQALQQIQSGLPQPPKEPSKDMFEADPIGYMEAKLKFDEDSKAYAEQVQQLQQVAAQQGQAQQAAQRAYLEREMETLKQVVPEFADPEKAPQVRDRLVTKGQEVYGYSKEEISSVMDHRAIRVLNDALKYQEMMSGKAKAEAKAKPKNRRTVKAGAKKTSSNAQAQRQTRQKLKKSGSIDDALSLILGN